MPEQDDSLPVVREWVAKAEGDLSAAARLLSPGEAGLADVACFHAQQCVEKYLKACLTLWGIPFPKTHDIEQILLLIPAARRPELTPVEAGRFSLYATVTRYPGDYDPVSIEEARIAVEIARRVRTEIRKHLPAAAVQEDRR